MFKTPMQKLLALASRLRIDRDGGITFSAAVSSFFKLPLLKDFKSTGITDSATANRVTLSDTSAAFTVPVQYPPYTTAARPSASVAGVGAAIFDTTLKKPVFSDGTGWYDATGSAV